MNWRKKSITSEKLSRRNKYEFFIRAIFMFSLAHFALFVAPFAGVFRNIEEIKSTIDEGQHGRERKKKVEDRKDGGEVK